ncbi:hypothetical protein MBLNU13_g02821t2 [Cladosporium sp. NU13]
MRTVTLGARAEGVDYERRTAVRCLIVNNGQICIIHVKKGVYDICQKLVIAISDKPATGNYYKLPGGGLEPDDPNNTIACQREALEKTGCEVDVRPELIARTTEYRGTLYQESRAYICTVRKDTGKVELTDLEASEDAEPSSELGEFIEKRDIFLVEAYLQLSAAGKEHLASYNWIEAKTPTIVVPGSPAVWRGNNASREVKKDSGLVYVAQNAARHPESPLEPLFRALYIENPSFNISPIDVISDRNNIRKLLSFVDPSSDPHGVKDFSMRMEFVNGTAILHREETKTKEFIGPDEFRGFGHEFEKAYTRNQVPLSTGHYRIVSYRFGGLRFVIRHETDGYVDDGTSGKASKQQTAGDDLSSLLGSMSISQSTVTEDIPSAASKLKVRQGGRSIALESTLEIKTRVHHKPLKITDAAPQLWLSQTPRLVRAYHNRGTFSAPVVEDVSTDIKRWETANQEVLGRLVTLLVSIIAKSRPHGQVSIRYSASKDRLRVDQCSGNRMFPEDLYQRWNKDIDLQKSDQETKRDGMSSVPTQTNVSTTAGALSVETDLDVKVTRQTHSTPTTASDSTRQSTNSDSELPCFVCQRMRKGRPRRHGSLHASTESSKDLPVCEIDHGKYCRKHTHLLNVYPSLTARKLALGEQAEYWDWLD